MDTETCKAEGCEREPVWGSFCRNHGIPPKDDKGLFGGHFGCSLGCTRNHAADMRRATGAGGSF